MNKHLNILNPNLKVSVVALCIRSGARYVDTNLEGLPHFVEHLFLNSRERQKTNKLMEFEKLGFIYNARTGKEFVNFYIVCKPGFEQQALDLLMDCSQSIMITQSNLDAEKSIIMTEIGSTSSLDRLLESAEKKLWSGSGLTNSILGTQLSINSITLEDINNYIKSNISKKKIIPVIISNNSTAMSKDNDFKNIVSEPRTILTPLNSVNISFKDGYVVLSIALPPMSELEQQSLDYVAYTLAGGWTSILLKQLRHELGLVYWINYKIRFHSDATTLHLIIRTNSQNELIVAQQAKEIVFNPSLYTHSFLDIMCDLTRSYETKQLLGITNPYDNLAKVIESLTINSVPRPYKTLELPSQEIISETLGTIRSVLKKYSNQS